MCGRFMLATPRERLIAQFRIQHAPEFAPRYNIAPSQAVATVRLTEGQDRDLAMLHWVLFRTGPNTRKAVHE